MSIFVFLQFVTRYFFNNSLAWTEEISSYLLICLTFVGSAMAVRKNTHIQIEFLYTIVSYRIGLVLACSSTSCASPFSALSTWLAYKVMLIMQFQYMAVVDWPLSYVYGAVFVGYAAMTIRSIQVIVRHWMTKSSELMVAGPRARRYDSPPRIVLPPAGDRLPGRTGAGRVVDALRLH